MERSPAYLPPSEPAAGGGAVPEFVPPHGFVDYWNWSRIADSREGVRTGRLAPWLREAARTRNPMEILRRAVVAAFRPVGSDGAAESRALADLAVSGRTAFAAFTAAPPRDDALLAAARPALIGVDSRRLQSTVRNVLDRAYTVAWALRGSPSQRRALRPALGWIALSGEDDSPHAPTNVPSSDDLMGEMTLRVGRARQRVTLRGTLALPAAPAIAPLPDIARRAVPASTAFNDALRDRSAAGYDDLFLFVHGLGSRAEESTAFKRELINLGAARGRRFAVLSVDMPGLGYSSRVDIEQLASRRIASGPHGFALPDGTGSNFPLLGLYRDTLVTVCNQVEGGVQHVMGGSLGGNMTLWLASEPMFTDLAPALAEPSSVVSFLCWSPGSIWESYERSRDTPFEGNGTHMDIGKNGAKKRSRERMLEREDDGRRWQFFEKMQRGEELLGLHVLGAWGYPPTRDGLLLQSELYSEQYRRTFWAAAYEQVTFSHQEPLAPSRRWPFQTIAKPLLLAAGARDDGDTGVMDIYNPVVQVSDRFPAVPGRRHLMLETGHSISDERPRHLAGQIVNFLRPNWRLLDNNAATAAIAADGNDLYQLHRDGRIWKFTGPAISGWQELDNNPASRKIVAAGGRFYQLHRNGSIWRYNGVPFTGWELLDNNPSTADITADGEDLYQLHRDGRIWKFVGPAIRGWREIGNHPATRAIAAAGGRLYQFRNGGHILRFDGTPFTGWELLDNNPATAGMLAAGDDLYQLHRDGRIWKFVGPAIRGWQELDNNPATKQIAVAGGTLFQRHQNGSIWRYLGTPFTGWREIDHGGSAVTIVGANSLYQLESSGLVWRCVEPFLHLHLDILGDIPLILEPASGG